MKTFLFLLLIGSIYTYFKLSSFYRYEFVKLENYAGEDKHQILTVKKIGHIFSTEKKYICGETKDDWFKYSSSFGKMSPCDKRTEKILRKIHSVNQGRLDFEEQYPNAHLGI